MRPLAGKHGAIGTVEESTTDVSQGVDTPLYRRAFVSRLPRPDVGSGIDHYGMSVDGAPWVVVASDSREEVHVSDGVHTIAIRAVDAAGNIAVSSVEVTVDANVFSFGGPYSGLPTFGIVLVVAALAGAFAAIRRRRRTS